MAIIQSVRGFTPKIGENVFLAANATVVGDVEIGDGSSVWFGAVVRGDVNSIRIGKNVNVQDGAVLHTLYEKSVTILEDNVSIGHNAIIHGAKVEEGALVGMGAIVMDHVVVGRGALVAAGSVVLSNTVIEPGALYAGTPAKFVKMLDPEQQQTINKRISDNYQMYASWFPNQE
ncbi:Protein YrdA [Porphyromonas levii]|uniref:gamma carbonic anhydrase family protein n=1 Tax=Porphyromonas levii TaxID=28114 RepID=UPI001B8B2BE9|nr:gamma carbonic anhydrase family protein [Porphyromonas levii]MBR8730517.1 Protein YrdA [Porphyromonas levii]